MVEYFQYLFDAILAEPWYRSNIYLRAFHIMTLQKQKTKVVSSKQHYPQFNMPS